MAAKGITMILRVLRVREDPKGFIYTLGAPQPLFGTPKSSILEWRRKEHQVLGSTAPMPGQQYSEGDVVVAAATRLIAQRDSSIRAENLTILTLIEGVNPEFMGTLYARAKKLEALTDELGRVIKTALRPRLETAESVRKVFPSLPPAAQDELWPVFLKAVEGGKVEILDPPASNHFTVFGTLSRVIKRLLPLVPRDAEVIVEPFCGKGELVWYVKAPLYVLADKDPDIIKAHRICRDLKEEDYRRLRRMKWVGDADYYDTLRKKEPKDDLEWYHRLLYLARFGRRGPWEPDFRDAFQGLEYRSWESRVGKAQERLRDNVKLEVADFRDTLRKYDSEKTFFFLDPPWPSKAEDYYKEDVSPAEIAEALRNLKGTYTLVIEGSKEQLAPLRGLPKARELKIRRPQPISNISEEVSRYRLLSIFTTSPASSETETRKVLEAQVIKANEEHRYTLSVVYMPGIEDAHGDMTNEEELFKASVEYVSKRDRGIYHQHGTGELGWKKVGEWVHLVQWPYPVEAEFRLPDGSAKKYEIPAGSVYMGVIWEQDFWEQYIKTGRVRGYSFGGRAQRWEVKD